MSELCNRAKTVWGYSSSDWHCTRTANHGGPCALQPGRRSECYHPSLSDERFMVREGSPWEWVACAALIAAFIVGVAWCWQHAHC